MWRERKRVISHTAQTAPNTGLPAPVAHLLSDILNGLIAEGFVIRSVWENPRPGVTPPLQELEPGSNAHRDRFIPFGLSVVSEGTGPRDTKEHT
jgi:hypothetical protein